MNKLPKRMTTRADVVAWVRAHPGCRSREVADAFEIPVRRADAHLARAVEDRSLERIASQNGRSRFTYGPVGFSHGGSVARRLERDLEETRARIASLRLVERDLVKSLLALDAP